jgi:hypothetical protein
VELLLITPAVADHGDGLEDPFSNPGFPSSCWVPPDAVTVRLTEAVCVLPPPVAVIVIVAAPTAAAELADNVRVADPEPGAAIEVGLNAAVTPEGRPEADNDTAELKPPEIAVEIVVLPELPCDTEIDDGDAETEKSGLAVALTVRLTLTECDIPPPVPVTVIVELPVAAEELAVSVKVEEPEPGAAIDVGLKLALTPEGSPEADKDTAELKPPEIVVDKVELPEPPCVTETEVGEALMVKFGVGAAVTVNPSVAVWLLPPPVAAIVTVAEPTVADDVAVTVRVDEPEPGAAIVEGLKLALTPEGSPEAEREIAELNDPDRVVDTVELPDEPCWIERLDGEFETEKSLEPANCTSNTGCSSMPLGATPVWPCRKSNMPTPVIVTGILAVWKLVVTLNFASNSALELVMPFKKGLPLPTQWGAGISQIMVCPLASLMIR